MMNNMSQPNMQYNPNFMPMNPQGNYDPYSNMHDPRNDPRNDPRVDPRVDPRHDPRNMQQKQYRS